MGYSYSATCRACGKQFRTDLGGGRRFEQLRCDHCGKSTELAHSEIGEPWRKCQEDLAALESVDSGTSMDSEFERMDRLRNACRQAIESSLGQCACGGRFLFGAPARCPACRSADIDLGKVKRLYD